MQHNFNLVLNEIESVLKQSDFSQIEPFVSSIIGSNKIVVLGAGRVGFVMKSFGMRLSHLGKECFFWGDANVPKLSSNDLLIIGSGSGNTSSIVNIVDIAVRNGIKVICITANKESQVVKHSSNFILLNSNTKETSKKSNISKQPMTTLFEQSLWIFLDSLVLKLMDCMNETNESMQERHNILE